MHKFMITDFPVVQITQDNSSGFVSSKKHEQCLLFRHVFVFMLVMNSFPSGLIQKFIKKIHTSYYHKRACEYGHLDYTTWTLILILRPKNIIHRKQTMCICIRSCMNNFSSVKQTMVF